jgi:hypothetical protein
MGWLVGTSHEGPSAVFAWTTFSGDPAVNRLVLGQVD